MSEPPVDQQHQQSCRAPRGFLLFVAALQVLVASGEAYGWTALRPVLHDSGYFDSHQDLQQASKLNVVATAGIAANALCKLPLGCLLDQWGPRLTSALGSTMLITGSLLIALGDRQSLLHIAGGYFLLGTSGPFIQMPCFQFSNLFPGNQGSVITLLIACFELSTGVFFLFNLLHFGSLSLSPQLLFSAYAAVGLLLLASSLVFWPDRPCPESAPEEEDPSSPAAPVDNGEESRETRAAKEEEEEGSGGEEESLHPLAKQPVWRQVLSWEFSYAATFLVIHIFRQGFVLSTVYIQLHHFFGPKQNALADLLADLFSVFLPLGFIPMLLYSATGCSAYLLSRPSLSFFVSTVCSMTYGLLFLWPSVPGYLALFALFPVARQLAYSTFFSYSVSTFGYATFGQVSGVACFIAGLVQLSQWLLVEIASDPNSAIGWEHVNILLATVPAVLLLPVAFRAIRSCLGQAPSTTSGVETETPSIRQPLLRVSEENSATVVIPRRRPSHNGSGGAGGGGSGLSRSSSRGSLSLYPVALRSQPIDTPAVGSVVSFNSLRGSPMGSSGRSGVMSQHGQQGGSFTSTLYSGLDQR
eukprot:CAMPEP_0117669556 /NCGR_PEP_ID=MMETSP0804-20121206/12204_1 /TAXON_ID=1074897 /ORGANISM="Tetraselmis astigmatica, Strain CCMP880" /LENGTH=583 /DNA_ID=CAMNT_0005477639 /DNA_START=251 /DNA_END=2002 /DNA_ORIENTATION=+